MKDPIRRAMKLLEPRVQFAMLAKCGFLNWMDDTTFLKIMYKLSIGERLNLNTPQGYNEKLQWLKLYDRKPEYTRMVDKYEAKKYVAERIGEEYIIPTLGVWERFDDIDFDALPEQFVLKCTHDSGGLSICRDKSTFNKKTARKKIEKSLKRNYYMYHREQPYKDVKPRIIAEKYMEDPKTVELRDYKFFCFDGKAEALYIATERQKAGDEVKFDFFDMDFHHLPFKQGHPNAGILPEKPQQFDLMRQLAETLAQGIPHVRVDFYEVGEKVYFGELTFYHYAGFAPFDPPEWDGVFGKYIKLPTVQARDN